jgi:hypothetical protein
MGKWGTYFWPLAGLAFALLTIYKVIVPSLSQGMHST